MERGTIFKFHNDLDTDQIIASQYLLLPNLDEMKDHAFESLDPDFAKKVKPGDFVVGGENFGCGSSREQAPGVFKALGVQAVVAKSFARIFYRNAINIGLPAIVCKDLPDDVKTGDSMELSYVRRYSHCKWKDLYLYQAPRIYAGNSESGRTDRFTEQGGEITMGMTIAEKIIAAAAGVDSVKPGDIHTVQLRPSDEQ